MPIKLKKITNKNLLILLFAAAASALALAYIAQYIFGIEACHLCFYQRKPFLAIVAAAALTLTYFRTEKSKRIALYICTILLLINFGIAAYHSGVEKKFFSGPTNCTSDHLNSASTLEELKDVLMKTQAVRCDEPTFFVLGLTMANWNLIYCFLLLAYIAFVRYQRRSTLL